MAFDIQNAACDVTGRGASGWLLVLVCSGLVAAVAQPTARAEPPPQSATRPPAESPEAPRAAKPDSLAEPPDTLDFQPVRDGIITGLGLTFWVLEETVLKDAFAPDRCRWCDCGGGGADTLNGLDANFRDLVRWDNVTAPDTASDITTYVLSPVIAFGMGALAAGREGRLHEWRENSLEVMEAMVLATAVNKLTKVAFARKRPYAHFRTDQTLPEDPDENESFSSGHTSLAFSLAVAGGTIATIRGYKTAPWVWGVGLSVAAATGYFRMAADQHYITDVLGGAATGAAIGWAVPWFLGRRDISQREPGAPAPSPLIELRDGGAVLGVNFVHLPGQRPRWPDLQGVCRPLPGQPKSDSLVPERGMKRPHAGTTSHVVPRCSLPRGPAPSRSRVQRRDAGRPRQARQARQEAAEARASDHLGLHADVLSLRLGDRQRRPG